MKKGGNNSAADYGSYIWGQNQHAVPGNGNLIQAVGNPNTFSSEKTGGKGIITAAAVPAVLITANHFLGRRGRKERKERKERKGRTSRYMRGGSGNTTQNMLDAQMTSMNQMQKLQDQLLPQTPSGTIFTNSAETTIYGGKGVLETIAVPAVLLTANHLYRPRKSLRKGRQTRGKRSRRYSTKRR